jgi:Tfp pilus assembly protein FimT
MHTTPKTGLRLTHREGYTVLELVVVVAVLIILGAVIVPTISGYYSNTRQKSAADLIRSRVVEGRAKAMEQGIWYRLAINQDKKRIRLAPDGPNFSTLTPDNPPAFDSQVVEDTLDNVTAEVTNDPNSSQSSNTQSTFDAQSSNGSGANGSVLINGGVAVDGDWVTVMTVGPEGICKEDFATVTVKEANFQPILIQVRGIVGSAGVLTAPSQTGSK